MTEELLQEMIDALGWYESFYHDVQATTPEYFELCGDLNATMYLKTEASNIQARALDALHSFSSARADALERLVAEVKGLLDDETIDNSTDPEIAIRERFEVFDRRS